MMNICPNCKNPVDAEDKFCARCGTPLNAEQPVAEQQEEPVAEIQENAEQNQPVFMAAELDGQPIVPAQNSEDAENVYNNVPPYYNDFPAKKKSVLPIVLAAVGGAVLIFTLIAVALIMFLCGGSKPLKWGMTRNEVVHVMLKEGFVSEDAFEEAGEEFEGYIKDVGEVDIDCMYNENGELFYVAIHGEQDGSLDDFLDKKCGKYKIGVVMGSTIRYLNKGNTFSVRPMGSTETFWISFDHAPQEAVGAIEAIRSQLK